MLHLYFILVICITLLINAALIQVYYTHDIFSPLYTHQRLLYTWEPRILVLDVRWILVLLCFLALPYNAIGVVDTVNVVGNLSLPWAPALWLLGFVLGVVATKHERLFVILHLLCTERNYFAVLCPPPTVSSWKAATTEILPLYELTSYYTGLALYCPYMVDKIWGCWVHTPGIIV